MHGPYRKVHKAIPEMRTPPLIRTLQAVPRVFTIERFHCIAHWLYVSNLMTCESTALFIQSTLNW